MISIAYSLPVRTELKDYSTFSDNQAVRVFGATAFNDMASEIWVYKTASMAVDNGTTVIRPTDIPESSPGRFILFEKMSISDYANNAPVSGGSGNVTFYLTSDKTASGTALFKNVTSVIPFVNDSSQNYTYSYTAYNPTTKSITVNVKVSSGLNVALVGLTLLGVPTNVPNGTNVYVLVKGN